MKNKMFKKIVAALVVSVMALSLAACGSSDSSDSSDSSSTSDAADSTDDAADDAEEASTGTPTDVEALKEILDGTTVSWMTCQGKYHDEFADMAEYIYETYGCTVDFQVSPDDEYFTLLKVKLSTGEVPDLFEYNTPLQNAELSVTTNCVDLSDEPWVQELVNASLATDPDDGNIYCFPESSMGGLIACFYNVDILTECGVTNFQPSTYDEWLEILDTVEANKSDDVTTLYMSNAAAWTTQVFMTAGIPILMDDPATTFAQALTGEIAITDIPEYEECLTMFTDLIAAGYVNEDHLSVDYNSAIAGMGEGTIAMYVINNGYATEINSQYPDVNLSAMVIPYGDEEILSTSGLCQGLFVCSEGEQIDVTKAFLQAWSSAECQQIYFDSTGGYPSVEGVDGGDVAPALLYLYEEYVVTGKIEIQANDYLTETSSLQSELFTFYVSAAAGISTPAEAIEDFEAIFEDYQQQQGVEGF